MSEHEQVFSAAFHAGPLIMTISDLVTGRYLEVNENFVRISGFSREEAVGNTSVKLGLISKADRDAIKKKIESKGRVSSLELNLKKKDGSLVWCSFTGEIVSFRGKRRLVSITEDITERKRTDEALRESEARFVQLAEQSATIVWEVDAHGLYTYVSQAAEAVLGYRPEELIGRMHFYDLHPASGRKVFKAAAFAVFERMAPFHNFVNAVQTKDGRQVLVSTNGIPLLNADGTLRGYRGSNADITAHKRAEDYHAMGLEVLQILNEPGDLRNSIQRVIAALKTRPGFDAVGIRLQDGDDFPYCAQQGFSKDFLLTENTLVERGKDGGVCRDKDGNVSLECTCGLVISGKTDPANPLFTLGGSCWTNDSFPLLDIPPGEDPRLHPRNQCIHQGYASVALVPIRNKDRIVGLIQFNDRRKGCFTLDTVEQLEGIAAHIGAALMRKRAEEELAKNHDLLGNLVRLVPGVIYQYRLYPDGRSAFPYSSPGMNDIYEVTPEEMREDATPVFGRLHPDDHDRIGDKIRESARTLRAFYCEFRVILPRQGLRWRWSQAHPERMEDGGTLWHGIISDITERKLAEEKLRVLSARQEAILAAVPEIIMEVDHNKVYTWANQAGVEFFGEDVIGKEASAYFVGEQVVYSNVQSLFDGHERVIYLESWQRRKDGEKRMFAWWCRVLKDVHGHVTGALSTARDITEHKQAEEALKQNYAEIERFNNVAVGRELRMVDLKKEVNALLQASGQPEKYRVFDENM